MSESKKAEYFKDWLANKINNRELAWRVKSKLLDQVRELENEIRRLSRARDDLEAYQEVLKVMQKHGLNTWYNPAEKLDKALKVLDDICKNGCSWEIGSKECVESGCPIAQWRKMEG